VSESVLERLVRAIGPEAINEYLSAEQREALPYDWRAWARPEQLAPDWPWRVWLILAGRGFGKTRTGAEWVREQVRKYPMVNLIGATADDARDIMIQGESGILAVCPLSDRPVYRKAERKLIWPNGATSLIFTADEPDRLRGKQHMKLWCDELAAWRYPESWDQAMLGLRLGDNPQAAVTTTPRPIDIIRELKKAKTTHVTTGSTYDNRANLAGAFFDEVIRKYEGTRLGRQELMAELLEDTPGALWTISMLDKCRIREAPEELNRVVVGVDPSGGRGERGIVSAGIGQCNCKGKTEMHGFVLGDASGVYGPDTWGRAVVSEYDKRQGDRVIVEKNFGGDMAAALIRTVDNAVAVVEVTASRGKALRAEPVAALYEQGKVHHVGPFQALEDQMCNWSPLEKEQPSPDRLDALVWALTHLMVEPRGSFELWGGVDLS
jgi:phage terminase large subunit-like protein